MLGHNGVGVSSLLSYHDAAQDKKGGMGAAVFPVSSLMTRQQNLVSKRHACPPKMGCGQ